MIKVYILCEILLRNASNMQFDKSIMKTKVYKLSSLGRYWNFQFERVIHESKDNSYGSLIHTLY